MTVIGILLIANGIGGIACGSVAYGDIGIACLLAGSGALLSGIGCLLAARRIKKLEKAQKNG